ncbi:hypothetical protein [Paenibacillus physcomitrellae]|uniref:Uncharacterized protein n=1 Tax=Paenibacillus physcomitrellae TaxID=1619311 RepID=A0ABQ1GS39_9BACL|nr:hypothetical protein [Paenibacillus physcomitrellae]GGA49332.1 hypothetical protein GCM10010917_38260 [Paenibacillus physcomitrellae]
MDRSTFYQSRNGLFVVLAWIALILVVLRDPLLRQDDPRLLFVIIGGGIACSLPTLMHYKNLKISSIPYITAALFALITCYALARNSGLFNFLTLYISLLLCSLYSNSRLILFNGCLVTATIMTVSQLFQANNEFLADNELLLLGGSLLTTAILAINARRFEQAVLTLVSRRRACEQMQTRTTAAAADLQSTADLLYNWSTELELELEHAVQVCQDIRISLDAAGFTLEWEKIAESARAPGETASSASTVNPYDIRERFLRITVKMLHLSEQMMANRQSIEDIHAGLSHQYGQLSGLIQAIQGTGTALKSKPGCLTHKSFFSPAYLSQKFRFMKARTRVSEHHHSSNPGKTLNTRKDLKKIFKKDL